MIIHVSLVLAAVFTSANIELVVSPDAAPTVRFAAQEAKGFLDRTFAVDVPVVSAPRKGRVSLVLGENEWSKAAGVDLADKPRDTFVIKAAGDRVYVVGRDDPKTDPLKALSLETWERATLFGVYEFLERHAGVRMYFPGELGEVVPRKASVEVPEGEVVSSPHFLIRRYYNNPKWDGVWYDSTDLIAGKRLNWYRTRGATTQIPCCHGTIRMKFVDKYKDSHPEYFALRTDGTRCTTYTGAASSRDGHLCYSSAIRDRIVEECVARLTKGEKYVDIMPNDGYPGCQCADCQKVCRPDDASNFASELIWGYTAYVANRLLEKGFGGYVTQMAYRPYRRLPDIDLPTNVLVMVAEEGPWSKANPSARDAQYAEIRAWKAKVGHPVWIWTYPHKYGTTNVKGLPDVAPKAWAEYYQGLEDDIIGAFAESETDKWIYHYLNYYVFGKVMWNPDVDVDALLDEHYALLFGAAAKEMKAFYELLERKWVFEISGNVRETEIGPVVTPPTEREMWTTVYGADTVARLERLLDAAVAKVAEGSIEAKRIAFFRREYLDELAAGSRLYAAKRAGIESLCWKTGETVELKPFSFREDKPHETPVKTRVTVTSDDNDLVFLFDCEDDRMNDLSAVPRRLDDPDMWKDAGVEIFLNPSGDRRRFYHVVVNAEGSVLDTFGVKPGSGSSTVDAGWSSDAQVEVKKRTDGWSAQIAIPLEKLPGLQPSFPVNVCRSRVTRSGEGYGLFSWTPYIHGFDEIEGFGTLRLR